LITGSSNSRWVLSNERGEPTTIVVADEPVDFDTLATPVGSTGPSQPAGVSPPRGKDAHAGLARPLVWLAYEKIHVEVQNFKKVIHHYKRNLWNIPKINKEIP
jgi:hypothetical protein